MSYYYMDSLGWHPGFFCSYQSVVGFLNFIEEEKEHGRYLGMYVDFKSGLYFDDKVGPNWWEYYFEPIQEGNPLDFSSSPDTIQHIGDSLKSKWCTDTISVISRERASQLINKYIKLKDTMQQELNTFKQQHHFTEHYMIGIHYRGTDKSSEAPRVSFDAVREAVQTHINTITGNKRRHLIFIATDEQGFLNFMKNHFRSESIVYLEAHRSQNHDPIHHKDGKSGSFSYSLGKEAVLDCMLLAACDILIRTHSNLSSSAANINPNLPVIHLNQSNYRKELR